MAVAEKQKTKSKISIRLKAFDNSIIDQASEKIIDLATRSGAIVVGPVPLPTEIKKISTLRSPHVHKTSFEQFEMRVHKRLINVFDSTPKTIDNLMSVDLPQGVDIEIKT